MTRIMHKTAYQRPREEPGSFRQTDYDLIIIGAGAAGLSAGIFAARRGLTTAIIGFDLGGQTASTAQIENYPGCGTIEGPDLISRFYSEAVRFGCIFLTDRIEKIERRDDAYLLSGTSQQYTARAVIVATGKTPRRLGFDNEDIFLGHGIVYGGAFDPLEYVNKRVVIVGGGNSAMGAALRLAPHASHITVVHRGDSFAGEKILLERVQALSTLECQFRSRVSALQWPDHLESVEICVGGDERQVLPLDAIIVAIGFEARNEWVSDLVACTKDARIIIDSQCQTNCAGIFAAGDCTDVPYQQIVVSAGEGAKAAISAYHYISKKQGKRTQKVDWGYV
ncbi:MAG: FAD-dependent oxidoreductase [Candidatus Uhrbacteria bacterium]|nr:FAD-dependent oxidoreductase [Candidatus Uhrbacteria bacterium]